MSTVTYVCDVPRLPKKKGEVLKMLGLIVKLTSPLLIPSGEHQPHGFKKTEVNTLDKSSRIAEKLFDTEIQVEGSQVLNNQAKMPKEREFSLVASEAVAVDDAVQPTLAALMVTLGPHGFMIIRRCPVDEVDTPLLRRLPPTDPAEGAPAAAQLQHRGAPLASDANTQPAHAVGLYFQPPHCTNIVSVSGAGDCLASGFIAGMLAGLPASECASLGNMAAALSLEAGPAVPASLSQLRVRGMHKPLQYTLVH